MDRIKKKRKKTGSDKKVLLSIVNPWDVKVASVDPVGLAERRGVSLSTLPSNQNEGVNQEWPTLSRPVKIPSPWYKPGCGSTGHVSSTKPDGSGLIDPYRLNPWYPSQSSAVTNVTNYFPSPGSSGKGGDHQRNGDARHDVEADEVDNGVINSGSQEIGRDDFDADGTASARVRFEIGKAESKRNGVRCENGQSVNGASQVTKIRSNVNDNTKFVAGHAKIVQQSRANVATARAQRNNPRGTNDAEVARERNANGDHDDSRIVGEKPAVVDIVKHLVESRYSSQTATERRAKRMPSCRQQETSREIDPVGKMRRVDLHV